jgi:protein involved in polysaccharide export with SLBB domain
MIVAGCQSKPKFADLPGLPSAPRTGGTTMAAGPGPGPTAEMISNPGVLDRIQVGDNLYITFADLPPPIQPPIEERVRDDGTIRLIQDQTFVAAGKMRGALEKEIRDRYVPKFFKTMTVTVTQQKSTQFYYVDGEVKRPDRQVYISRLRLTQAIASAMGFTDFARKKAVVLTRADGRTKITVNCVKAQTDPTLDPEVYPGDKIWVPRRNPFW